MAVDIRPDSPTFGQWYGITLTAEKHNQIYIPPGFAHGFYVLSNSALVSYKCTSYYNPAAECGIIWNDPDLAIQWPLSGQPIMSGKDSSFGKLADIPAGKLPRLEDC